MREREGGGDIGIDRDIYTYLHACIHTYIHIYIHTSRMVVYVQIIVLLMTFYLLVTPPEEKKEVPTKKVPSPTPSFDEISPPVSKQRGKLGVVNKRRRIKYNLIRWLNDRAVDAEIIIH